MATIEGENGERLQLFKGHLLSETAETPTGVAIDIDLSTLIGEIYFEPPIIDNNLNFITDPYYNKKIMEKIDRRAELVCSTLEKGAINIKPHLSSIL